MAEQFNIVLTVLASALGPPQRSGPDDIPRPLPVPTFGPRPTLQPFGQNAHVFLAAVAQGTAMQRAITAFSSADNGGELTRFSPRIRRIFPSGNIRSNPGKFRLFGPYDITIGSGRSASYGYGCVCESVTEANLNNASFQWGCNLTTDCSVFVQLCLRNAHLFSGVEGRRLKQRGRAGGRPAARLQF